MPKKRYSWDCMTTRFLFSPRKAASEMRRPRDRPGELYQDSHWIKSSLSCANGKCVEVTILPDGQIGIRDSNDPGGPILRFTPGEWRAFVGAAQDGEFDGFGPVVSERSRGRDNRYSFLRWVLADPRRTLRFALLLAVGVTSAVLAPHVLALFL